MSKLRLEYDMKVLDKIMGDVMGDLNKLSARKQQTPAGYATTIEINGYEFDAIVDYEIEEACKGSRNEYGVPMEPDYPASITLGLVWIFDGIWQIIDVPEEAMKDTLDEILAERLG